MDRAAIERSWTERGFSCGLWVDPPGQVWSDYVHETDELVMVVDGDVEFEIDGKAHRPSPGEELLIPARARHTVRNLGRGGRAGCTATGDDDGPHLGNAPGAPTTESRGEAY